MPPRSKKRPARTGELRISTVDASEALSGLRTLRAGRRGRTSEYQPVLERVRDKGEVVRLQGLPRTKVFALRAFLNRYLDRDDFRVKSERQGGTETYAVTVGRREDL